MSNTSSQPDRILAVMNSFGDFNLIREDLRLAGFNRDGNDKSLVFAQSLAKGITLAKRDKPDVVLLDLSLPDSSGAATVRAMRAALPDVPIVAFSEDDDHALAVVALEAGAQDFLVKVRLDYEALGRAVRHALVRGALESRLRLFEAALNSATHGIIITDLDTHVEWANPAFTQLTGFTLEEMLGKKSEELFKPGLHNQAFYQSMLETIRSDKPWHGEMVNLHKDGTPYHEELAIAPVTGGDGTVRHFVAIKRDITPRKTAEEKIHRLSRLYSTLSQCNEAIVQCPDEETLFQRICDDMVHFGGLKMAWIGLVNSKSLKVDPVARCGDDLNYLKDINISAAPGDPNGSGPTGVAIRENRPFWCLDFQQDPVTAPWRERGENSGWRSTASLPFLRNGAPIGAITVYADTANAFAEDERQLMIKMAGNISYALEHFDREAARSKAEIKLRELNQTLELRVEEELAKSRKKDFMLIQQSRLAGLGGMVQNISHHWRQPLTALGLVVDNLQMDFQDNLLNAEELEKYVDSAKISINRMTGVIDDFRDFFKSSTEKRVFFPSEEVEKAIIMISPAFARDNIEIVLDKSAGACSAFGHPREFAQVVLNVLTNAKEAFDSKTVVRKIRITVRKNEAATLVAIHNNGDLIPENILSKVFDPYFSSRESGTGMGLYLSKIIMQNMGGDISIQNDQDGVEVLISQP